MLREKILQTTLAPGQAALWYLGQMGFLLQYGGKHLLVDGYLSDLVDRRNQYAPGWTRRYAPPILPEELDFVDYVLCTHSHCDHTDPETLKPLVAVNQKAQFFVPAPVCSALEEMGIPAQRITPLYADVLQILWEDGAVTPFPAAHEELHQDDLGNYKELGLRFALGSRIICHTGDCCPYEGLSQRLTGCDVLILPINGRDYFRRYERNIIGNFDCMEAITLAKRAGAGLIVPAHYDLYADNGLNPAVFVDTLYRLNPTQPFHLFAPGEGYILG